MTQQKNRTLSRRSLFGDNLSLLVALVIVPSLAAACGTETVQQSGNTTSPAKKTLRSSNGGTSSRTSRSNSSQQSSNLNSEDLSESAADLNAAKPFDGTIADAPAAGNAKSTTPDSSDQPPIAQTVNSTVKGAKPDGGFFSRGAPQLSLAQIESGQQIRAKCEGSFHELVIEPEHLQALAQGQSVTIKSSTNTHFANPTVHNHSVTYSPWMG